MPELPEVERSRKLVADSCTGFRIADVETTVDKIVFCGGDDNEGFASELKGRTITGCERKGKMFWLLLSGEGRLPVMHLGMTGMLYLKGQEPNWYIRRPREWVKEWPPRFMKLFVQNILKLEPQEGSVSNEPVELAFVDGRRLARLRLLPSPPTEHPPLSKLGFDPVLSHPTLEEFKELIAKKKGTTKGMIMDQAFSAGVGNWVADEILYQARIHPACPVPALSSQDVEQLWHWIREIPMTAVAVNADHMHFPDNWLFRYRWGKGKKQIKRAANAKVKVESEDEEEELKPSGNSFLALPDGSPATISFIEVGGRTTAVVDEMQKMPTGVEIKPKIKKGPRTPKGKAKAAAETSESDASESSVGSSEEEKPKKKISKAKVSKASKLQVKEEEQSSVKEPKTRKSRTKAEPVESKPVVKQSTKPSPRTKRSAPPASKPVSKRARRQASSDLSDAPSL